MRIRNVMLSAALLVVGIVGFPAPAAAQRFWVSPFVGTTNGNDLTHSNAGMGISAGATVFKKWIGVEGEFYNAQLFFKDNGFLTNRALKTGMGNVVVGVPYIKSERFGVYGTAGLGVIRPHLEEVGGFAKVDTNKSGYNVGGGVIGNLSKNIGIRGDVRYFRTMKKDEAANAFGIDFGSFHFWRSSVGLVLRF